MRTRIIALSFLLSMLMGCSKEDSANLSESATLPSASTSDPEIFNPSGDVVDAISGMLELVVNDSSTLNSPIDESIWFLETGVNYALSNAVDSMDVLVEHEDLSFALPLYNDSVNHTALREAFIDLYERVESLVDQHEAHFRFADVMYVDQGSELFLDVRIVLTQGYASTATTVTNFMIGQCKICNQLTSSTSCPWKILELNALRESRRNYGTFSLTTGFYSNVLHYNDNTDPNVAFRLINTDFLPGRCNALFSTHRNSFPTISGCLVHHEICLSNNQLDAYTDAMIQAIDNVCRKKYHPIWLYMRRPMMSPPDVVFWETHRFDKGQLYEKSNSISFQLNN